MTPVYAIVLVVGIVALFAWLVLAAVGTSVDGWEGVDPERRFGRAGRFAVAGLVGFGMAGMSSTFAGWPVAATVAAALAGAAGLAAVAHWFGPEPEPDP